MVLNPSEDGTRVGVAVRDVAVGQACHLGPSNRTRVAYVYEGEDATITHTTADSTATCNSGVAHGDLSRARRRRDD